MRGAYYFVIVGQEDIPLFEITQGQTQKNADPKNDIRYLYQFVAHSALDMVDEKMWLSSSTYLKIVDRFNEWLISAFVAPSDILFKLHLAHCCLDKVRQFFQDVYEAYVRLSLNPFYESNERITSEAFLRKVQQISRKHFG
ncbi:unnamed protein product [Rodentolepis nana]|uniref:Trafficking protein particle complex subunit 2 n=1 Tax=Rodentolepis nana TaxID=102285 RepID=A0A0R3TMM2_RODNA|nr:unnamed protein product [Rodentolepis nana]